MSSDISKIHNIEAEQIVLGAIISNNQFLDHVIEFLKPNHFYDSVHRVIFEAILTLVERGLTAHHISISQHIGTHGEIGKEIKEKNYLLYLTALAVATFNVKEYANMVYDLAVRREIVVIATNMINTASSSGLDNPAINQIENAESNLFNLIEHGSSESGFTSIKTAVKSSIEHIDICIKKGDKTTGISCGLIDLDDIIHGFHNSDLVILAARPGMGKTTLMLNFTYEAGAHFLIPEGADKSEQKSVGIFSLEMQSEQLATKLISMQSSVSSSALMSGRIKEEEYNRLKSVQNSLIELPIYIDDTAALSISSIRTRARRLKRKHNLGILFIDYLQLIQPSRNMQNRVLEITEITQGLKALAKELNIPIVALSQLSREVEKRADKRPLLSDLRESGSIEQDADIVMFIYRDEYYDSMRSQQQVEQDNTNSVQSRVQAYTEETRKSKFEINKNRAEVIVAKHRKGRTGVAEIYFNAELSKFDNLNKTYEENT